jgi:hypothetical protein
MVVEVEGLADVCGATHNSIAWRYSSAGTEADSSAKEEDLFVAPR